MDYNTIIIDENESIKSESLKPLIDYNTIIIDENESIKNESLKTLLKGKDGATPIKGIDYFDGKDGKDGKDGAIQYTAGENIEISTNNVIKADINTLTNQDIENLLSRSL